MRDYDPTTGRYLQADPLGLVDGASDYGYARQNPSRYIDPRGENPLAVCAVPSMTPLCGKVLQMCVEGAVIGGILVYEWWTADGDKVGPCENCSSSIPTEKTCDDQHGLTSLESAPVMSRPVHGSRPAGLEKINHHFLTLEVSMEEPIIDYPSITVRKGSSQQPLTAKIFAPVQTGHGDYSCAVELTGIQGEISTSIFGVDRSQAVCLAINFLADTIINSSECQNGEIASDDGSELQLLRAHYVLKGTTDLCEKRYVQT